MVTMPCLVFGQEMSIIIRGLQYSTLTVGSLEEGGNLSSSSGTKPSTSVWTGGATVDVVLGHWATAVVVVVILVVVILAVVDVMVTVVGRVVVLVTAVEVSMYTITEEEDSGEETSIEREKKSELMDLGKYAELEKDD